MKTKTKALAVSLCAILLVVASVMGTMAYLTSTDKVENTFTVGNVQITLDEADVDTDGTPVEGAERVKKNEYHLMPGHTYTKDPTVHFAAGSEASYLFVKVENGIKDIIDTTTNIENQITTNGWTKLDGVDNVYYKTVVANNSDKAIDHVVFGSFKIKDDVNGEELAKYNTEKNSKGEITNGKQITVTAYAVQQDGFEDAKDAWTNTFGKTTTEATTGN